MDETYLYYLVILVKYFGRIFCNLHFFKCLFLPLSLRFNGVCPVCRFLGVPPGRGSCPLTGPLPFDLIYTDYHGLQQMKQHMGLSLRKHKSVVSTISLFFSFPSFLVRASRHKPPFVSLLGSKCRVFPVIASLIKHFIIGLLAGWRHRPVTFFFFFLCQQSSQFGGDPIWAVCTVINQAGALFKCATGGLGLFVFSAEIKKKLIRRITVKK